MPREESFLVHPIGVTDSIYPLTAMDCLQAAMPPIAFCLFYNQQVDDDLFRQALERSLSFFPCLAGRIIRTNNKKQAPLQVKVHAKQGGAHFTIKNVTKPYDSKDDRRWFPSHTGPAFPTPHEPHVTYGPLLRIKLSKVKSDNSCVISFAFCHAVMDATSVGEFLKTLSHSYNNTAHNNSRAESLPLTITTMYMERVFPNLDENPCDEPLKQFSGKKLIRSIPKLLRATALAKTINLTIEKSELERLKSEFVASMDGELKWISTYEMLGVLLLRAFYLSSKKTLEKKQVSTLECRCIVDPRKRSANTFVSESHQGNVGEMPSIILPLKVFRDEQSWKKTGLNEFHAQLRSSLEDPKKMTNILRKAQASLEKGNLHTKQGRMMSSFVFARNILETNVTSYNSWLHIDWFGIAKFGTATPHHFQVTPGMNCLDMFWLFPKTKDQITIRTTLPPKKATRFLKVLTSMNVSFEVQ